MSLHQETAYGGVAERLLVAKTSILRGTRLGFCCSSAALSTALFSVLRAELPAFCCTFFSAFFCTAYCSYCCCCCISSCIFCCTWSYNHYLFYNHSHRNSSSNYYRSYRLVNCTSHFAFHRSAYSTVCCSLHCGARTASHRLPPQPTRSA